MILNTFISFENIRRRTSKSTEIRPNLACFWPLKFFWGMNRKILNRHYKIKPNTDHRAKFHASRPTHLGDLARKKKQNQKFGAKPNVNPPGVLSQTKKN